MRILSLLMMSFILVGCACVNSSGSKNGYYINKKEQLYNTTWQLDELIFNHKRMNLEGKEPPVITFTADDFARGMAFINNYFGKYDCEDKSFSFPAGFATGSNELSSQLYQFEKFFLLALGEVSQAYRLENKLYLSNRRGTNTLIFSLQ